MKIALLGYGKMGQLIGRMAAERGHEIVLRKTSSSGYEGLETADVAIDFSAPDAAIAHISAGLEAGVPVICGTTGWLADFDKIVALCREKDGAFLYGSNFSLGVNIFFGLNEYLATIMSRFPDYKAELEEIHHTQKRDAPSGTAISLANGIIAHSAYEKWTMDQASGKELFIEAKRIENVPGTHSVFYHSKVDSIEIKHTAHTREGFAYGAVIAAEWLAGKKGVYSMKDVLDL